MRGSVRKRGKRWYYYFYADIDGVRKKVERVGGDTRQEAIKALNEALHNLDKSNIVDSTIRYSKLIDIWFKEHVALNCRGSTSKTYKSIFRSKILPALGRYKVSELKPRHGQQLINKCSKVLKKSSLQRLLMLLKITMDYAVYPLELINANPFRLLKLPAMEQEAKRVKTISVDEFNTLINYFEETHYMYILLNILFYTGCRFGEAHGLTWADIDFNNKLMNINKTTAGGLAKGETNDTKTISANRKVYMSDELIRILREYKSRQSEIKLKYGKHYNDNNLIVCKRNGEALARASCFSHLDKYNKQSEFKVTFHMLRHTHATLLLANNTPVSEVSKRLGHSNPNITLSIYSHETERGQKEIANIFDNIVLN